MIGSYGRWGSQAQLSLETSVGPDKVGGLTARLISNAGVAGQ